MRPPNFFGGLCIFDFSNYLLEIAACCAMNKTVYDLVNFLMINLRKGIDFSANYVIMVVRLSGVLWHITQH